ncbi:MAG TPA: xanthine dehydrogenase family protein subunit M [Halanaerobiales bacterium]|nr:xanthine dehydrogenase family protein subunit M [Halanaerobiales bacterium]
MKKDYSPELENRQKTSGKDSNQFYAPKTINEALEVMADNDDYRIIAGGTDIMVEKFEELYEVNNWLAIDKIKELKEINKKDGKLEIGAGVTYTQLLNSNLIKENVPALKDAALDVGSPQIRNRGTIGGNIVTSSPAGDLLPVLLIYNAEFILKSKKGQRKISANDFFTGVKKNELKKDEILSKIIIPLNKNNFDKWIKIGKRKALVISSLTLAVRIQLDDDCQKIEDASLAMGAVAPTPLKIDKVGKEIIGKDFSKLDYEKIAEIVENEISPIDDIRGTAKYRSDVAFNITLSAFKDIKEKVEGC